MSVYDEYIKNKNDGEGASKEETKEESKETKA